MIDRPELKDRNCTIYFSSKEELEYWRNAAKGSSSSLCGYILEMARRGKDSSLAKPMEGAQDLARLREENARLRASEAELRQIVRRAETESFKLRFADVEQDGYHELSGPLMELLEAARRPLAGQEILRSLNIDTRDLGAMKALLGQLRTLQAVGLIEENLVEDFKSLGDRYLKEIALRERLEAAFLKAKFDLLAETKIFFTLDETVMIREIEREAREELEKIRSGKDVP